MKTIIAIVCLLFVCVAARNIDVHETARKSHKAHNECIANPSTTISKEDGKKLVNGEQLDQSVYAGYVNCMSNHLETQKSNGEADLDVIRKFLIVMIQGTEDPQKFLEECSVQKDDSTETAKAIFLCFNNALTKNGHPDIF